MTRHDSERRGTLETEEPVITQGEIMTLLSTLQNPVREGRVSRQGSHGASPEADLKRRSSKEGAASKTPGIFSPSPIRQSKREARPNAVVNSQAALQRDHRAATRYERRPRTTVVDGIGSRSVSFASFQHTMHKWQVGERQLLSILGSTSSVEFESLCSGARTLTVAELKVCALVAEVEALLNALVQDERQAANWIHCAQLGLRFRIPLALMQRSARGLTVVRDYLRFVAYRRGRRVSKVRQAQRR